MPPSSSSRVRLEGSDRTHGTESRRVGPANPADTFKVLVILRPSEGSPELPDFEHWEKTPPAKRRYLQRAELGARHGASQEDADKVISFASDAGLSIGEVSLPGRMVELSGTVDQFNRAFGVTLELYETPEEIYRGHEGAVFLPRAVVDAVQAVFGLDSRKIAFRAGGPLTLSALTPPLVSGLYDFPEIPVNIASQTIGIFEFGGGYTATDLDTFFAGLNPPLPPPNLTAPVSVLGHTNSPGDSAHPNGYDPEVELDIDVAGSVAVGATLSVYFSSFDEVGVIASIITALAGGPQPVPSTITISYAFPEESWSAGQLQAMSFWFQTAAAMGVTVFVATGDKGSMGNTIETDGRAHACYPAIDPWVTAVGGTTIGDVSGTSFDEVTWVTGVTAGGISTSTDSLGNLVFPLPSWQVGARVPPSINDGVTRGRGVPDIAGYANGYGITIYGSTAGLGGTSEAAPLYAGLTAILNAKLGYNVGYLNPTLYSLAETPGYSIFNDIDDDASNAYSVTLQPPAPPTTITSPGYRAVAGWDACTGWGSIRGTRLFAALASAPIMASVIANGGNFGDTGVGTFIDETLTIDNSGFGLLAISGITSDSPDFLAPNVSAYPLLVSVGGSIDFDIRFAPVSIGPKSATITLVSNDPSSPHIITVSGEATVPRLDLIMADNGDFGPVCATSFVDEPLVMSNSGQAVLSISEILSSSDEFQVPEVLTYPLTLAPGAAMSIPIRFAPVSLGSTAATITVFSNDPQSPSSVEVSGQEPAGKLSVTGSAIFGGVRCGTLEQHAVSVCNTGGCELEVSEVSLRPTPSGFRLVNNPFPATLLPGSCLGVVVEYLASERGASAAELMISSNDPDNPVVFVDVTARTIWEPSCDPCCKPQKRCSCDDKPKSCCKDIQPELRY